MAEFIFFLAQAIAEFAFFELGIGVSIAAIETALTIGFTVATAAASFLLTQQTPAVPFAQAASKRTQLVRQAVTTRKLIFGEIKVSGTLVLWETTNDNRFHHLVVPLCDLESSRIGTIYFNDVPIYTDQIDGAGEVISGRYSGKARINKHLGTPTQLADTDLVAEVDKWTDEHRGREVTYLYVRIDFDRDTYPNGIPNISAIVQGQKLFDPRTSTTRWSPNPALALRSYLLNPRYGWRHLTAAGIDDTFFNADANSGEEFVAAADKSHDVSSINLPNDELTLDGTTLLFRFKNKVRLTTTGTLPAPLAINTDYFVIVTSQVGRVIRLATSRQNANDNTFIDITDVGTGTHTINSTIFHKIELVDTVNDILELNEEKLSVQTGDKVEFFTTGTLPTGLVLGTSYFVIVHHEEEVLDEDDVLLERCAISVATTYFNALDRVVHEFSTTGSGDHIVQKTGEPRFTTNGMMDSAETPHVILSEMLSSMAGAVTRIGGLWKSLAGVYRAPGVSLNEDDLAGKITTPTRIPIKKRFNRIRGSYSNPKNNWQPSDYPAMTKTAFQTADGGLIIDKDDFDLPYTTRTQTAQRLALIGLNRMRQEIIIETTWKTKAYREQPGGTENISNTVRGWVDKVFEVIESTPGYIQDSKDVPIFVVKQLLRETAASVFDFNPDVDEVIIDDAPNTNLPDAFKIQPPTNLLVAEELYVTRDGAGLKVRALLSWTASPDLLVQFYQVEHKLPSDSIWKISPTTRGLTLELDDIDPVLWDFRVKAINEIGRESTYATKTQQIFGLASPPTEPQNLTMTIVGGTAYLRWDKSPDVDVRIGGEYIVRHSKKLTGATWTESMTIGPAIGGNEVLAVLPLKEGTYMMKAKDASAPPVFSLGNASVTTKQASVSAYTTTDTLTESPTFAGTKVNLEVITSTLRLTEPGGSVSPTGNYTFSGGFDFGAVSRRRITTTLDAVIVNINNLIDDELDLIDDWLDFDGTLQANADIVMAMRQTDDDPTGSPTWGPFERIESGEIEAWGAEFKAFYTSDNTSFNIHLSELVVKAESIV